MFTGLVEAVGRVQHRSARDGDLRLVVSVPGLDGGPLVIGESIAVAGVCLTVASCEPDAFSADVSAETLACTRLGQVEVGAALNLERALRADARLGGHFVTGHVDGVGELLSARTEGGSQHWRIAVPPPLMRYLVPKGSVCVDGVSLTVNTVGEAWIEVNLVPHTIAATSFAHCRPGDPLNLEVDLLARHLERLLAERAGGAEEHR